MLQLESYPSHADVIHAGRLVGRYNYRDEFKPYLHPLATPRGHVLSLSMPHDHRHHKGLMYALTTQQANFWEEGPSETHAVVGRIQHVAFNEVITPGDEMGFVQTLRWVYGDNTVLFDERRTIRCRFDSAANGYRWQWQTRLTARQDTRLIKSYWAWKLPDGRRIDYHGLGIRMRREFGGSTGNYQLLLDGKRLESNDFTAAMGATPREVTYIGSIDQTLPIERASVSIRQHHGYGLFAMNQGFAYLSFGPSNLEEVALQAGQVVDERYEVLIADVL